MTGSELQAVKKKKKKANANTEILLGVMRYYHSTSISCTDSSFYFTPKPCRPTFTYFFSFFIYLLFALQQAQW